VNADRAAMIQSQVHRGAPTFSGKFVNPQDLRVEDICIEDIAHQLSQANRYMGACDVPYNVAQHSVLCARVAMPGYKRATLFHDAEEAYWGDLSRVIKYGKRGFLGSIYRKEADKTKAVIERALGFEPGELSTPEIKWADDLIGDLEWGILIERNGDDAIIPWSPAYSEQMFLDAASRYC